MFLILAFVRQGQVALTEFEANLVFTVSSSQGLETLSQKQRKKKLGRVRMKCNFLNLVKNVCKMPTVNIVLIGRQNG